MLYLYTHQAASVRVSAYDGHPLRAADCSFLEKMAKPLFRQFQIILQAVPMKRGVKMESSRAGLQGKKEITSRGIPHYFYSGGLSKEADGYAKDSPLKLCGQL